MFKLYNYEIAQACCNKPKTLTCCKYDLALLADAKQEQRAASHPELYCTLRRLYNNNSSTK